MTHGPVRVLFVDHSPIVGGAQLTLVEHLRTLDRARFHPMVLCASNADELQRLYRAAGAEVHVASLPRLRTPSPGVPLRLFRSARLLRALVARLDADVVVASTSRTAYIAALALAGSGVPLAWWVHDFQFNRVIFRVASRFAGAIICVSDAIRTFYGGQRDARFHVIPVGSRLHHALESLDPEAVSRERARWGYSDTDVVIGFMGRLVAEKGAEDLVHAVAALHASDPRVKLLVVGTGRGQANDVEGALHALVERNGWRFVSFAGFQSDEALYYKLFDVLALPSRAAEGYAMSAVQAMLAGTPVVVTAVGGMMELVRDRETGLLVPPGSPERMSSAIAELIYDSALRERVIAAGQDQVMRNNRVEVTTRQAEAVYERIARRRMRRHATRAN